jgi:hypothetical protein
MAEFILALEVCVFAFGFRYIFMRDRLIGAYFFFLFLYALPAQIGYFYFSEVSVLILAYFEEAVWYPASVLILLSASTFLFFFAFARRRITRAIPLRLESRASRHPRRAALIGTAAVLAALAYQVIFLAFNFSDLNWFTAADEDFLGARPDFKVFIGIFKLSVAAVLVLYVMVRQKRGVLGPTHARLLLATWVGTWIFTSFVLGNRTDLLAAGMGIALFESLSARFNWRVILRGLLWAGALVAALLVIEATRYGDEAKEADLTAAILAKDYYAPAHMLYAAMAYNFVQPLEVLVSNTSNALVMLNYPYLQGTVTDLFRPDVATRSAGYAFYIFTEGYLFAGALGFLYNGFIPLAGLLLWKKLASTRDPKLNALLIGLMGCMVVNLVRSQSSYFIKYLYTFVLPGVLMYTSLTGQRIALRWRLGSSRRSSTTTHKHLQSNHAA